MAGAHQVVAVAAAPIPSIGEIDHGFHVAFAHLHQQMVESGQQSVVEASVFVLQHGADGVGVWAAAVGTGQDA